MRAVRIALVIAGLLLAAAEVRGQSNATAIQPAFDRAVDTAKAEMLRDPARAMQEAERARLLAHGIGDPGQRSLALATADWLRGEGASRLGQHEAAKAAIAEAMRGATEAPLETLRLAARALALGETVVRLGNPSAASDAGVGVGLLAAAAHGAAANVRINLAGLPDDAYRADATAETEMLLQRVDALRAAVPVPK